MYFPNRVFVGILSLLLLLQTANTGMFLLVDFFSGHEHELSYSLTDNSISIVLHHHDEEPDMPGQEKIVSADDHSDHSVTTNRISISLTKRTVTHTPIQAIVFNNFLTAYSSERVVKLRPSHIPNSERQFVSHSVLLI
jgi:hypothetical protein